MIDIATGLSIEPPTACSTRNADQELDGRREAAQQRRRENTARPQTKMRRRPKRSAVEPENSSRLAITTV